MSSAAADEVDKATRQSAQALSEAREIVEAWRLDYNANRPHSSLGNRTPEEFVRDLINSLPSPLLAG
jgi:transposase InsO family protein